MRAKKQELPHLSSYPSYRFETSQTMIPVGMAIQVIKNHKASIESRTGNSTMYITVPILNQKNQRVIFYFAIDQSLEDHPRSTSMVESIVGNPGLLTLLSPLG